MSRCSPLIMNSFYSMTHITYDFSSQSSTSWLMSNNATWTFPSTTRKMWDIPMANHQNVDEWNWTFWHWVHGKWDQKEDGIQLIATSVMRTRRSSLGLVREASTLWHCALLTSIHHRSNFVTENCCSSERHSGTSDHPSGTWINSTHCLRRPMDKGSQDVGSWSIRLPWLAQR